MKRKSLSKILALGMAAVMTAAMLAGCGNSDAEKAPAEPAADSSEQEKESTDAADTSEAETKTEDTASASVLSFS